ncbi:LOW QUALITY PROTEIN: HERV-H LTR-associating protein 2 [Hipposideros larvatus]
MSEQIFIGKLDEDVMIPCSFESGPKVVIHWRNQDNSVYMYLKDSDHLETQIPDTPTGYSSSTGNFRRSNLLDEITYMCYIITWQVDNTPISKSNMEEIKSLGPFYTNSRVNITRSNSSYECAIENSLLKQKLAYYCFLPNQDFTVTWSRVESGTFSILAYSTFLSSSQNTSINKH